MVKSSARVILVGRVEDGLGPLAAGRGWWRELKDGRGAAGGPVKGTVLAQDRGRIGIGSGLGVGEFEENRFRPGGAGRGGRRAIWKTVP